MTTELKKRTWHYIYPPSHYECMCDADPRLKANTTDDVVGEHKVTWSEYAGMLWCYTCEKDTNGFGGIFSGPIPVEAAKMMLGDDCFDRWDMKKREVQTYCMGKRNIYYKRDKVRTALARRNAGG